jgi:pyruvate ferredoxin oxidoreductase gamma subunit
MYRIRFHGRGGQGMKTASRILGSAFFREGFEVQDAPRYGAERRGAPIFAYVRAARTPIAERGVIRSPDLVLVADDTLVGVPAAGVVEGLDAHAVLAVNSTEPPDAWRARLNTDARIVLMPAFSAEDPAETPYVGAICAGAAARLTGVIGRANLEAAMREELSGLSDAVIGDNLARCLGAFDALADAEGCVREREEPDAGDLAAPDWVTLDLEDTTRSAPAIHAAATSVMIKTGLWRTMRPIIDYDLCKRCNWVCGSFCPDSAIAVDDEGYPRIDYDHCKGCMICLAQCPPHAIHAIPEKDAAAAESQETMEESP